MKKKAGAKTAKSRRRRFGPFDYLVVRGEDRVEPPDGVHDPPLDEVHLRQRDGRLDEGGILPARNAARVPITQALRQI